MDSKLGVSKSLEKGLNKVTNAVNDVDQQYGISSNVKGAASSIDTEYDISGMYTSFTLLPFFLHHAG